MPLYFYLSVSFQVKFNVKNKGKEFMNMFGSSDEEEGGESEESSSLPPAGAGATPQPTTSPENKKKRKSPKSPSKSPRSPKTHSVKGADDSVNFINTEKPDIAPPDE